MTIWDLEKYLETESVLTIKVRLYEFLGVTKYEDRRDNNNILKKIGKVIWSKHDIKSWSKNLIEETYDLVTTPMWNSEVDYRIKYLH